MPGVVKPIRNEPGEDLEALHLRQWFPASIVRGPEILDRQPAAGPVIVREHLYLVRFIGAGFQAWVPPDWIRRARTARRAS